jgi:hypothetical protein
MKKWMMVFFAMVVCVLAVQAASPFEVTATAEQQAGQAVVQVVFKIPAGHFLYADHLTVSAPPARLVPLTPPHPVKIHDKFSEAEKEVFDHDVTLRYQLESAPAQLDLKV